MPMHKPEPGRVLSHAMMTKAWHCDGCQLEPIPAADMVHDHMPDVHAHSVPGSVPDLCGPAVERTYRYSLMRLWDPGLPSITWMMANPSTANAVEDDPTIRRVIGLSEGWGYGSIVVVNLLPIVSSNPQDLRSGLSIPERTLRVNEWAIHHESARKSSPVVVAWGQVLPNWRQLAQRALEPGRSYQCIGTNLDGAPKHPLYAAADVERTPWRFPA